ncbi:hypothetical protein OS493_037656 [Desmophyllum pertusum]|uniref:Oncoprotein-induced transcript 3 protein n=1 Tax=Desmophyllum pertusum TaxID=174260 RepID=A0A9W9ZJT4_9CNID|nr:hypothetical protein OS493_037656 [Desmophyllum pertusum]
MAVCHWLSIFLVGFAVLVLRSNSKGVCPNNWVHMQGSCYKYFSKALNWNAAKSACETLGTKLVVINSQAEQQAISSKLPNGQRTWIGLYRDPKDKSRWLWVDGTRPTYTYWYSGEPNNSGGSEDCGEMFTKVTGRKWNDIPCSFSFTYICETAASSCQKLSLRGGVHVSPSNCLSSNQKYGSTCSFSCTRGYRLSGPSSTKCGRGGAWSAKVNTVICNGLTYRVFLLDINECAVSNGGCSHKCVNTAGSYKCECPDQGLSLSSDGRKCQDINECAVSNGGCSHKCVNTAGSYKCECPDPGLKLSSDGRKCQDINECAASNGGCSHKCVNTAGSYKCECPDPGLSLSSDGRKCQDINECAASNGGCSHKCVNTAGSYKCECPDPGLSLSSDSKKCQDINECAVSNGGCSHKCVNTKGSYKCECPDPELSLSLDNRTCRAPGVDVQCNSDNMTIIIPKSLLRGIDREHLRLLDTTCKAKETSALFSLTTPLTGCSTTRRHTPTAIVYSNTVLEIAVTPKDVVTRVREIEIPFSCFYSSSGEVSSVGLKPSNRKLVFSDEGKGNFTLSLNMFPDKRFVSPYMNNDFPVAVVLRKLLFFEVSVTSGDKQLSIKADRCYATPTQDQKNSLKYEFITKGCPSDETVKYLSTPSVSTQRFSLEAFKFIAKHPFVFVHCHVIVCNATDPGSKCAKKCPSSGRGRREASDHVTGDVYSLAQGPLHLAREEKRGNVLDKSGSSPTLLMALFVMCVACLAGTALMVFKKSRGKPAGYAVLAAVIRSESMLNENNWTGQILRVNTRA